MATKSIFKDIVITDNATAETIIRAIETSAHKNGKKIEYQKPCKIVPKEQIKLMFSRK